jgi:tryptophanyl-tRNA synthetase
VRDLQDPTKKMSKSEESPQGTILLFEEAASIERKVKRAVTDTETEVRYDPSAKPGVSNLLELLAIATGRTPAEVAGGYSQYGPLKADAAAAVVEFVRPVRERFEELSADPAGVAAVLEKGAEKAQAVAAATLARAQAAIGLIPRS